MNPFAARQIFKAAGTAHGKTKPKRPPQPRPLPKPIADIDGFSLEDVAAGQRVILPYPAIGLSPNARGHWSKRSRLAKAYRRECWVLMLEALGRPARDGAAKLTIPATGPIRLHLDFFPPDRQPRDDDNAIASFKAGRDGIADALKADDSRFVTSHRWHPEPRSCVVVTLLGDA